MNGAVPLTMKFSFKQVDIFKFGVSHFDTIWITVGINFSLNFKALLSGCICYQVNNYLMTIIEIQ